MDRAGATTVVFAVSGVAVTRVLERHGHRQMCQVARCRTGFVVWVVLSLHLWVPRLDPVRFASLRGGRIWASSRRRT